MKRIEEPEDIKLGMVIRDKHGHQGVVVKNKHPWGFERYQYGGLTIINHSDPEWYELVSTMDLNINLIQ